MPVFTLERPVGRTPSKEAIVTDFTEWLKSLRASRNWTQDRLADEVNRVVHETSERPRPGRSVDFNSAYVSLLENGHRKPSRTMVLDIAEALEPEWADIDVHERHIDAALDAAGFAREFNRAPASNLRKPVDLAAAEYLKSIGASDNFEGEYTEEEMSDLREGMELVIAGWYAKQQRKRNEERKKKGS